MWILSCTEKQLAGFYASVHLHNGDFCSSKTSLILPSSKGPSVSTMDILEALGAVYQWAQKVAPERECQTESKFLGLFRTNQGRGRKVLLLELSCALRLRIKPQSVHRYRAGKSLLAAAKLVTNHKVHLVDQTDFNVITLPLLCNLLFVPGLFIICYYLSQVSYFWEAFNPPPLSTS